MDSKPEDPSIPMRQPSESAPKLPLSPWLVALGILALVVGLISGIIMAGVGARSG